MNPINATGSLDSIINSITYDVSTSASEDNKISRSNLKADKEKMHDERQKKIANLADQMKGVSQGKCFKFIKVVFKIVDLLAKPLSAITGNQLKLNLTKTLQILQEAKKNGKLMGLQINAEQISKVIENVKKHLSTDMSQLKETEIHSNNESKRIMQILDEIDKTFKATQTR